MRLSVRKCLGPSSPFGSAERDERDHMFAYSRLGFPPGPPECRPLRLRTAKQDKQQHGLQDRSCRSSVGHLDGGSSIYETNAPGWMGMEERMGAKCSARPKQQQKAACLMGLCGLAHGKEKISTSRIPSFACRSRNRTDLAAQLAHALAALSNVAYPSTYALLFHFFPPPPPC